ncbi:MAG: hypothetical protein AAGJ87_00855 [Pseudomonadota bacterium]
MKRFLTVAAAAAVMQFALFAPASADDDSGLVTTVGPSTEPEDDGGVMYFLGILNWFRF